MKNILKLFLIIMALTAFGRPVYAESGNPGTFKKILIVMGRGITNVATSPLELPRAIKVERQEHPRWWPFGILPRYLTYTVYRFASGGMDFIFHPFIAPYTDKVPEPHTKPMGLPDYVWQKGEVDY